MIGDTFRRLADFQRDNSIALRLRLRRITLFKELISPLPKPVRTLDVGGTEVFWERMGFAGGSDVHITLLNLFPIETHYANITSVVGDGRNMPQYRDNEFDVVFSNSVIEHVGGYEDQERMAREVQRVGKRYFVQTPNFYFPLELHFLFPFFQFLPLWLRVLLLRNLNLGWYGRITDREEAARTAGSVRLLKKRELAKLFPGATIYPEKLCGLIISYVVYRW